MPNRIWYRTFARIFRKSYCSITFDKKYFIEYM